jgi:hypothetical protein
MSGFGKNPKKPRLPESQHRHCTSDTRHPVLDTGSIPSYKDLIAFVEVRQEGNRKVKRTIKHYNLDTVVSVGFQNTMIWH